VTSIGFIGLGIMGGPMAANLIKAGHDVIGYDLSTEAVDQLKADGGRAAESLADAVREVDIVITMVPDSPEVKAAALGEEGIYANGRSGSLHIDCSSISPDAAREVAAAGAERGFRVVDAPVSGGQSGAVEHRCRSWSVAVRLTSRRLCPFLRPSARQWSTSAPPGQGRL